ASIRQRPGDDDGAGRRGGAAGDPGAVAVGAEHDARRRVRALCRPRPARRAPGSQPDGPAGGHGEKTVTGVRRSAFGVLGSGVLGFWGSGVLGSRFSVLGSRFSVLGYVLAPRTQNPERRTQNPEPRTPEPQNPEPENARTANQNLGT